MVTETGYMQTPTTTPPYTVSHSVAAIYTAQLPFEMMRQGIVRTYVYELMNDPRSPTYGLMTKTLIPKPSYTTL